MVVDWSQFETVAVMSLNSSCDGIVIDVSSESASLLCGVVYAWRDSNGTVLRVGTSKGPVGKRLGYYAPHINKALAEKPSPTPLWEAKKWLELVKFDTLTAVVHEPPLIETVVGPIRPYLDLERHLIGELKPTMNRSHR